jgi:glycosyltransferase involved in cell wall biosynthesis
MRRPTAPRGRLAVPATSPVLSRPRVLFLSCHLPWPALSGGRRRELELLTRLASSFDLHLVVVSKTPEQDLANAPRLAAYCETVEVFAAAPPSPDAEREAPAVHRHRSQAATARVAELVRGGAIDMIHVEGFYLMQHVPEWSEVPTLLVEQNVEFELERQRALIECEPAAVRRFILTEASERECWGRATELATVTREDGEIVQRTVPARDVSVVPDGADHVSNLRVLGGRNRLDRPAGPLIVLVANFGYAPNVDAASYLGHEILPLIRAQVPQVHLWLVGDAPPPEVQAMGGPEVLVTGRVDDAMPYLDAADVVLCPLRIGGGIKVKTIEALRRGKAVVSTSVGAQGLPRDALAVADEPETFADAVVRLLRSPHRRRQLEQRAARAGRVLPSWDDAARALSGVYERLLAQAESADPCREAQLLAGGAR